MAGQTTDSVAVKELIANKLVIGDSTTSGTITLTDNSNTGLKINSTSSNAKTIYQNAGVDKATVGSPTSGDGIIVGSVAGDLCLRDGNAILFSTNDGVSAQVTLNSTGKLGIGIIPVSNLHVESSAGSLPSITTQTGAFRISTNGLTGVNMGINSGSPYGTWIQSTNNPATGGGTYPLSLNVSGGNVGIGTLSPSEVLQVDGNISVSGAGIYKYKALSGVSGDFTGAATTFKFSGGLLVGTA